MTEINVTLQQAQFAADHLEATGSLDDSRQDLEGHSCPLYYAFVPEDAAGDGVSESRVARERELLARSYRVFLHREWVAYLNQRRLAHERLTSLARR